MRRNLSTGEACQLRTGGLRIYGSLAHNTSNENVGNVDPKHYHLDCDNGRLPQTRRIVTRLFADCAGKILVCASASLVAFMLLPVGGNSYIELSFSFRGLATMVVDGSSMTKPMNSSLT